MAELLRYRAGAQAAKVLREHGLTATVIGAFVGPASGPKWLVLSGLDRALLDLGLLSGRQDARTLLVGSSAGGWRILALASPDPELALQGLTAGYVHQIFSRDDTPETVSRAYREMFAEFFTDSEVQHILDHPRFDVALHTVRCRGSRSKKRAVQMPRLLAAAAAGCLSRRGARLLFERVLVHTRPEALGAVDARIVRLDRDNFFDAAMATGTVPLYMDPVEDLAGAPEGLYIDGGLTDYHLNERWVHDEESVVLFPHYRERIAPGWFDKHLPFRKPGRHVLHNLLQIFPSDAFLARLPDGRLPDRQDFDLFVDDPTERIRRWHQAVSLSNELGRQLCSDLETGVWLDRLESF